MKILMLLPCNKFAREGSYFKGSYWRLADSWRRKMNLDIQLGAIDCIPVFYKNENNAIVLENEMDRVKGYDVYPKYDPNKVDMIAKGVYNGLLLVSQHFEKIVILLNVKLYIEATQRAIEMLPHEIRNKIEFDYIHGLPGKFRRKIISKIIELTKK